MGLPDPHDARTFTHFEKRDSQGQVVAIIEVADASVADAIGTAQAKLAKRRDMTPADMSTTLVNDETHTLVDITHRVAAERKARGRS